MKKNLLQTIILSLLLLLIPVIDTAQAIWAQQSIDERQEADVAIVLGASVRGKEVSPVFRERINHGIFLYKEGYVKKIILTGGQTKGNELSEARIAMQYALTQGVPESDLILEETSKVTLDNLKNAAQLMDEWGFETALLVSDPLHMKRAGYLAHQTGLTVYLSPTPTSMYQSLWTKLPFLARETLLYIGYRLYFIFPV